MDDPLSVDLNCDLGESFGRYKLGDDAAMMSLITSANVACGFHGGDPDVMMETVMLAKQHGVSLGAHPGYPDLQGFGRRQMRLSPDEIRHHILYQVGALAAFARAVGVRLVHVKPHGALYNLAARDEETAAAVARAIFSYDPGLILVGLAGSRLVEAGRALGLRVANEGFPDRAYLPNGQLIPRNQSGAIIHTPQAVAENALHLVREGLIICGQTTQIDTLCLHGDNETAVENARAVREVLQSAGVSISPL